MKLLRRHKFVVPIHPIAWKRAGRNKNVYFDQQVQEKIACGLYLNKQFGKETPFTTGPLLISVTFYFRIPKSKLNLIQEDQYHYTNPDCSNCLKFIEDTLQDCGIIKNDNLFAGTVAYKRYSKNPRLEIVIEELPPC